ncbi:unnamed protein product, partial [Meganyctiphanes norvegica]
MVFHRALPLIQFGLYLNDIASDVLVSIDYQERGNFWPGVLVLIFVIFSWIFQCAMAYNQLVGKREYSSEKIRYLYHGQLGNCAAAAALFPVLPLICIGWSAYEAVIGKDNRWVVGRKVLAARVKLGEVLLEAFPQLSIQLYVICTYITDSQVVSTLQWISLSMSLASLSFGLADGFMFKEILVDTTILSPGVSWYPYKITWTILVAYTTG